MSTESIRNLPRVALYSRLLGKFIVVELCDVDRNPVLAVRGSEIDQYHKDIFKDMLAEAIVIGLSGNCIGGGKYLINDENKTVFLWSQSGEFGKEPNRELTIELFQSSFPDFTVSELNVLQAYDLGLEL